MKNLKYLLVGLVFGIVFVKAEMVSWFRMQEMFRFQSFFMYGVLFTAVFVGLVSVSLIRVLGLKTFAGEPIVIPKKQFNKGYVIGGILFGFGWALTGGCPGPLYAQIGTGFTVITVSLLSAVVGTWVYGLLRAKLPH